MPKVTRPTNPSQTFFILIFSIPSHLTLAVATAEIREETR